MKNIEIKTTCTKMLADIFTPVGIYLRLRDKFRNTVLLESADYSNAQNSWSYIGVNAIAGFEVKNKKEIEYKYPGQKPEKITIEKPGQVVPSFNQYLSKYKALGDCEIKPAQSFFGYTSYDAVQFFDTIEFVDNNTSKDNDFPLMRYRLFQYVIAINHFTDELYLCENFFEGVESERTLIESYLFSKDIPDYPFAITGNETSNMTDDEYMQMVEKGIAACHRGDVFQIVLSRRFYQGFTGDEFNVYRKLRSVNPSPYLFFFDYGDYRLFGSSPESQLVIDNGKAILHPIAGTFKRTGDDETDKAEAERLVSDEKENAEHVMLVDLARNDLSRHATNVKVNSYRKVHFYSHVIHLVSEVGGDIAKGTPPFNIMSDTFPAGTLSGAPKYKAMQLINEFEPTARSYYGGAIGIIGIDGNINHAIAIRTFMSKDNTLHYQAGAGVVAKSKPELELQEVNNKLGALKKALE